MRMFVAVIAGGLLVSGCGGGSDRQADALDRAAGESDPAAAAELRNQADVIRDLDSDANISDPNSPAQNAMEAAGEAAARNPANAAE